MDRPGPCRLDYASGWAMGLMAPAKPSLRKRPCRRRKDELDAK